jgi:acetyl-CoA C-acetyltransferase
MKKNRRKVFMTAGYNTIALGTGRKEFNPRKPRPGLEDYIREAGQGTLTQVGGGANVDEGVISNFRAARFNRQGNLAALIPASDVNLRWKPCTRVEGACGSGGLGLVTAIKSILAGTADVVLTVGVEVQNTVKAIYGADILAGAGWYRGERKTGHAYFFPALFSDRAGAYFEKFGRDRTRRAFARWYRNAVENARLCETAQEYHNACDDLEKLALTEPNPRSFVDHLNVFAPGFAAPDAARLHPRALPGAGRPFSPAGDRRLGLPRLQQRPTSDWDHQSALPARRKAQGASGGEQSRHHPPPCAMTLDAYPSGKD